MESVRGGSAGAGTRWRLRFAVAVSVLAVALLVVRQTGVVAALTGGGPDLDSALEAVPADTSWVEFLDRDHLAQRLGVADVHTGASPDEVQRYLQAVGGAAEPGTALFLPSLAAMQSAPFSELDVDWSLIGRVGTTSYQVFRLDDGVDLDAVGDDLVAAGFTESSLEGRRHFTAPGGAVTDPATGLVAGHYPPSFLDVTVDPSRHLLLVGPAADDVLRTLDGDDRSVADVDTLTPVLPTGASAAATEVLLLDVAPVCGSRIGNLSLAQRTLAATMSKGMGTPQATAFAVTGRPAGTTTTAALLFASTGAATADAAARTRYLRTGRLINAGLIARGAGPTTVRHQGEVVTVAVGYPDAGYALGLAQRGDGFLLCHVPAPESR